VQPAVSHSPDGLLELVKIPFVAECVREHISVYIEGARIIPVLKGVL